MGRQRLPAKPAVSKPELDLVVLVADADAREGIRNLLEKRHSDLGIRPVTVEILRHPERDPGVFWDAQEFLRPYLSKASYAMVLLDWEGSGQEHRKSPEEMEIDLETRLRRNGWVMKAGADRAVAIVVKPELETWLWCDPLHISKVLNIPLPEVKSILENALINDQGKPERPKEAFQEALKRAGRPRSARIYGEIAYSEDLRRGAKFRSGERSFDKFLTTLRTWFPP